MARIGLTQVPRRTQQHVREAYGLNVDAPSYRRGFDYAVGNRFPAEFVNGRWMVDEADLDKVARAFGLVPSGAVNQRFLEGTAA